MDAEQIRLGSVSEAAAAIEAVGAGNADFMATRAIHLSVMIKEVPADRARFLKNIYNDVGAEAAISHEAYFKENELATDILVMGTLYQHREVRRVLAENDEFAPLVATIESVVENCPEARD